MNQFCPLCQKIGYEKKIKAVQINYEEALIMCESETCPWPFGCEELRYISQKADFLDMQPKKLNDQKSNNLESTCPDLIMYTPPFTPKGDHYASSTIISSNSNISNSTTTFNNRIKKGNDTDQTVKKRHTLPILPSVFDTNTKKNNSHPEIDNQAKSHDHIKNHVQSKEPWKSYLRIRSVEKVHVQLKPNNYSRIISGKHNTKPPLKVISKKELSEKVPLKNITSHSKSIIKSATSQSLTENDLNRQNLDQELTKDYEYNQIDINKPSNKSFENNQSEQKLENFDNTLEQMINHNDCRTLEQNTKSVTSDQRDMSSISSVSLDNFLDEILLSDVNSTQLTENIDDDWLTSLI